MRLKFEAKTSNCAGNNCPARYRIIDGPGGKVFIGKKLDAAEARAQRRQIGPDEDAFFVPDDLM